MNNKKIILLVVIGILLIASLSIGMSYAFWNLNRTQDTPNELLSGCFSTTLTDSNNINLTNQFPISDATGLTGTPYTFTISNTCTIAANYQINLETLSTTTANSKFIKLSLDGSTSNLLNSYSTVDTTITGATASYELKTGYISAGSSITYNLRLWITESATIDDMANKTFNSKIVVNTAASHDSLEDALINTAGGKTAIAAKTTPDFSQQEPLIASYESNKGEYQETIPASVLESSSYVTYGSSYTYDKETDTFTISNPQSCKISECYSQLSNKYFNFTETSDLNASSNESIFKINTMTYDADKKEYNLDFSLVTSFTSFASCNVLYGDSYSFDSTTGEYSIINGTVGKFSDVYNQLTNKYLLIGSLLEIDASYTSNIIFKIVNVTYDSTNSQYFGECTGSYGSNEVYDSTSSGMYSAPDDYGTSYYYRGEISDNNIIFGGFCWKAVRVNGDGTTRIIYNGTPTNGECTATGDAAAISESYFNDSYTDNTYVGYMYGSAGATTYETTHANTNNSTIKSKVDTWYATNLTSYASKISDTLFCNDRSLATGTGIGTSTTTYAAYNRLITNSNPTLTCTNKNDRFTTTDTSIGNGNLTYPVGLITGDELVMGGLKYSEDSIENKNNLYNSGKSYWTMTPSKYGNTYLFINQYGHTWDFYTTFSFGIRPVINLKSNLIPSSGNGTKSHPYQIS